MRSSKNKLLDDGGVDWKNMSEATNKSHALFTPGTDSKLDSLRTPKSLKKTSRPRKSSMPQSAKQKMTAHDDTTLFDISLSPLEKRFFESPSQDGEPSPDTQAIFNCTFPRRLFTNDLTEDVHDEESRKSPIQESFLDRYKRLRNKNTNSSNISSSKKENVNIAVGTVLSEANKEAVVPENVREESEKPCESSENVLQPEVPQKESLPQPIDVQKPENSNDSNNEQNQEIPVNAPVSSSDVLPATMNVDTVNQEYLDILLSNYNQGKCL